MNKYQLKAVLGLLSPKFDKWFPEGWFLTGSSYLLLNNFIDRPVHDIDIVTKADHFHSGSGYGEMQDLLLFDKDRGSSRFKDDECHEILCFKLEYNHITIDVLYNPFSTEDNIREQIVKYKIQRLSDFNCSPMDMRKHEQDLNILYHYDEFKNLIKRYERRL